VVTTWLAGARRRLVPPQAIPRHVHSHQRRLTSSCSTHCTVKPTIAVAHLASRPSLDTP
jgi:hypothetical protein